jgi:hypothetical protein
MDQARGLKMDSRLVFKNPEVEGRGIFLRLRFKKENADGKEKLTKYCTSTFLALDKISKKVVKTRITA